MTMQELLDTLAGLDVTLSASGASLRYDAPPGVMTPALTSALAAHKAALLPALELRKHLASQGVTLGLGKDGQPVVRLGDGAALSDEERAGLRQHREVLAAMVAAEGLGLDSPTSPTTPTSAPTTTTPNKVAAEIHQLANKAAELWSKLADLDGMTSQVVGLWERVEGAYVEGNQAALRSAMGDIEQALSLGTASAEVIYAPTPAGDTPPPAPLDTLFDMTQPSGDWWRNDAA